MNVQDAYLNQIFFDFFVRCAQGLTKQKAQRNWNIGLLLWYCNFSQIITVICTGFMPASESLVNVLDSLTFLCVDSVASRVCHCTLSTASKSSKIPLVCWRCLSWSKRVKCCSEWLNRLLKILRCDWQTIINLAHLWNSSAITRSFVHCWFFKTASWEGLYHLLILWVLIIWLRMVATRDCSARNCIWKFLFILISFLASSAGWSRIKKMLRTVQGSWCSVQQVMLEMGLCLAKFSISVLMMVCKHIMHAFTCARSSLQKCFTWNCLKRLAG